MSDHEHVQLCCRFAQYISYHLLPSGSTVMSEPPGTISKLPCSREFCSATYTWSMGVWVCGCVGVGVGDYEYEYVIFHMHPPIHNCITNRMTYLGVNMAIPMLLTEPVRLAVYVRRRYQL